jgi:hypothetical protein
MRRRRLAPRLPVRDFGRAGIAEDLMKKPISSGGAGSVRLLLAAAALCLGASGCGAAAGAGGSAEAGGNRLVAGGGFAAGRGLADLRVPGRPTYGGIPLSFMPNVGQAPEGSRFVAQARGLGVGFGAGGLTLAVSRRVGSGRARSGSVRLSFVGARGVAPLGERALPGRANYFVGNDRSRWRTDVPTFGRVRYRALWPGVDGVFYGNGGRLEYDFVVAAGVDPGRIALRVGGARALRIDRAGNLIVGIPGGRLQVKRPHAYQLVAGRRVVVASRFALDRRKLVRFVVGAHDHTRSLVIDPVLVYSTYLGGSANDFGRTIAVDAAGSAYLAGDTISTDFPTLGAYQPANAGGVDVFVAKLNPAGNALVYSTYLGGTTPSPGQGNNVDNANGIAVDSAGNAYIAGGTNSTDFPTTAGARQPAFPGGFANAFVTKLSASGSALLYSTYLGGNTNQSDARAIALDASGNAYVTGQTNETTFPATSRAYQQTAPRGPPEGDAFVAKFNPSLAGIPSLVYATYLGGAAQDAGQGIAVDAGGNAYVTGYTMSTDFPTLGPYRQVKAGGYDAFVTKLDPGGSGLVYSTYVGGSGDDFGGSGPLERGNPIAVDADGNAYVTGSTASTDFPTMNPLQPANGGGTDALLFKLNSAGDGLVYSTYLGGAGADVGTGIAVDPSGNAYVTGGTRSSGAPPLGFPTSNAIQGGNAGGRDAFVSALDPAGSALAYSTYLGGSGDDFGQGIAVDAHGNAYVVGATGSPGSGSTAFPTAGPIQAANAGGLDAFIVKLGSPPRPPAAAPPAATSGNPPPSVTPPRGGPTAVELALRCAYRKLVLTDVVMRARRVSLVGAADKSLAGQRVEIVFGARRKVASAVVGRDGSFSTTAPLPNRAIRDTSRARYTARVGKEKSLSLKLTRRVVMEPLTSRAATVALTGQVVPPLTRPAAQLVVQEQVSCTQWKTVARRPGPANGKFQITVAAPADQQAAVYRVSTAVRKNLTSRKRFATFSLPLAVQIK